MRSKFNKFLKKVENNYNFNLVFWLFIFSMTLAVFVDAVIRKRRLPVHPYLKQSTEIQKKLGKKQIKSSNRLFIYFVDAFRFKYATNPEIMPYLNSLLQEGTWGKAKPCLTNMTVHCVEAAFSGIDRSSLLSFGEDFHPKKSKNVHSWIHQMAARGYKIGAVSDYVIETLYSNLLAAKHVYKKGASQWDLTRRALKYFNEKKFDVSIVHLLGAHDVGRTYGADGPEYIEQLRESDDILKEVVQSLGPDDTLLVFGDHGINDVGQHTYNTDTPTFYLYRGPDIKKNQRIDISLKSHSFFLNVLFKLPFYEDYQGKMHWSAFTAEAKKDYGNPELFNLQRQKQNHSFKINRKEAIVLGSIVLLAFIFFFLFLKKNNRIPVTIWLLFLSAATVLIYLGQSFYLPLLLLVPMLFLFCRHFKFKTILLIVPFILLAFVKAYTYRDFDILIHEWNTGYYYFVYLLQTALAFAVVNFFFSQKELEFKLLATLGLSTVFLFLLHHPTLYYYGVIRAIPFYLILYLMVTGFFLYPKLDSLERRLLLGLLLFGVLFTANQIFMFVENFRIFYFKFMPLDSTSLLDIVWSQLAVWMAVFVYALYHDNLNIKIMPLLISGAFLLTCFSLDLAGLPPLFYAGVMIVLFIILAIPPELFRVISKQTILFSGTVLLLPYLYQFELDKVYQIFGLAAIGGIFAWIFKKHEEKGVLSNLIVLKAIPPVLLAILILVVGFGFRTNGIDYKFAVKWMPELYEKLWYIIFVSDVFKYFLGILFLMLYLGKKNGRSLYKSGANLMIGYQIFFAPFLIFLFLFEDKVPLIVDSMEEFVYFQGVVLFLGLAVFIHSHIFIRESPHGES
ncbi:MAG: alkaline phosphatase family protein [Myxococcota bacterium]